ncbi:MAG: methyl-accepting chemotaxis protein [Thermoanaerobacterales bacterium]|nr:methyl-accepting chemotaxis protein [Bacillota bacterium]MDI6906633.1 methyl-accepting chemotaxis protein [Thermoanaerobacterales bacterium]
MRVRQKILAGYLVVLVMLVTIATLTVTQVSRVDRSYRELIDHRVGLVRQTEEMLLAYEYMALMMRTYLLTGLPEYREEYDAQAKLVQSALRDTEPKLTASKEKEIFNNFRAVLTRFQSDYAVPIMNVHAREDLTPQEKTAEIERITLANKGIVRGVIKDGREFVTYQEEEMKKAQAQVAAVVKRVTAVTWTVAGIAILLGIGAALLISQVITAPVKRLEAAATRVADGDLTVGDVEIRSKDEIGVLSRSFGKMVAALRGLVGDIHKSTAEVTSATSELTSSSQQVASAASETATAMSEVSATVHQVADNTNAIAASAQKAAAQAHNGRETLKEVADQMEKGRRASALAGETVKQLEQKLKEISKIVEFITLIADQTNLLALNAAIEAARAGEQGRGFAVVAEEVRKLAEQSATATKDIGALINGIRSDAQRAVAAMEEDLRMVTRGNEIVQTANQAFQSIIAEVDALAQQIHDVAAATEEVSATIESVTGTAEEQTATVEEVAAATDSLNRLAERLREEVTGFRL